MNLAKHGKEGKIERKEKVIFFSRLAEKFLRGKITKQENLSFFLKGGIMIMICYLKHEGERSRVK